MRRLHKCNLTEARMKFFLCLHTWIEHDFKGLVAKIAIGRFYTLNASALKEANSKTHKSCGLVMACWGRRDGERLKKSM